jgi:DNA-binding XRE family transcriptional regulator
MKTEKKLKTLKDAINEMSPESQARIKSIKKYYDTLYALRERRAKLGMTQADLAQKSGLPRPTISKIESGNRNIRIENLLRLSAALNLEFKLVAI